MRSNVNKNSAMDLISVCPKLIPVNNKGTFYRGFISAEVI